MFAAILKGGARRAKKTILLNHVGSGMGVYGKVTFFLSFFW